MKNELIELITVTTEQDQDGFPVVSERSFEVFADVRSIRQSEYYQASAIGIKVSLMVEINQDDYDASISDGVKPSIVRFAGDSYKIQRTYKKKVEHSIELTLTEVDR